MFTTPNRAQGRVVSGGFTLIELLAAITIASLVLAVSVPASMKLYESMRYRQAVRDVITLLASARYGAVRAGIAQDVEVDTGRRELRLNETVRKLPEGLTIAVHGSQELNYQGLGVIRFYPEGGASGGGVDIQREGGAGVVVSVDWLMGRVTQAAYGAE